MKKFKFCPSWMNWRIRAGTMGDCTMPYIHDDPFEETQEHLDFWSGEVAQSRDLVEFDVHIGDQDMAGVSKENSPKASHVSVLVREVMTFLNPKPGECVVDATVGLGGHAREILERIMPGGSLIAIDQDEESLARAKENLKEFGDHIHWVHGNFKDLNRHLSNLRIQSVDGILMDLGVSSYQLSNRTRGFSFMEQGPLDMRMNSETGLTAREVLETMSEPDLARLIFEFGQERHARRIAKAIVYYRKKHSLRDTSQLVRLIENVVGSHYRNQKIHPATRTFQALRIYVNDELGSLQVALPQAIEALRPKGRLVVIAFHSLEDAIVKRAFQSFSKVNRGGKGGPPMVRVYTRKPLRPSLDEIKSNPRARSARLRALEKLEN